MKYNKYNKYDKYDNIYNSIIKYIKIKYKTRSKKIIRKKYSRFKF